MGPEAALEGDGYHKGRPGNASIIGLLTFCPRTIAGVATQVRRVHQSSITLTGWNFQVYFGLSSKQEWYKTEGSHFDYEEFFWTIYDLFDDEEWGKGIITLWNKYVAASSLISLSTNRLTGSSLAPLTSPLPPPRLPAAPTSRFSRRPAPLPNSPLFKLPPPN